MSENLAKIQELNKRYAEENLAGVEDTVRGIISEVRKRGDAALLEYNSKFDNYSGALRVSGGTEVAAELISAIEHAASRITRFHQEEMKHIRSWLLKGAMGEVLGASYKPLDSVAIYIPGGKAALLSTVLMTAIPARVAGVKRIVLVSPPRSSGIHPAVLAAAKIAGVTEIYAVGGAQAIAAVAYGTESIAAVDKIVGPGNIYVSTAKKQVFGKVGIDGIYGPSELMIVADSSARPAEIAADLLSQLEHGSGLESTLTVVTSAALADAVRSEVEKQITALNKTSEQIITIKNSWAKHSAILVANTNDEIAELINVYAPEHLELQISKPKELLPLIRHAGAIFIGANSCESLGDYIAGPSHCLPTAGSARFSSGLQCMDFMKKTSVVDFSNIKRNNSKFQRLLKDTAIMARAEELEAHARAAEERLSS